MLSKSKGYMRLQDSTIKRNLPSGLSSGKKRTSMTSSSNSNLRTPDFNFLVAKQTEEQIKEMLYIKESGKMPIKELSIKNFKSIKYARFQCKKINLFLGQPNAGKSNILEAIGLISYMGNGNNNNLSDFVRFENLNDFYYDHLLDQPIEIDFGFGKINLSFENGMFHGVYFKVVEPPRINSPTYQTLRAFDADYTRVPSLWNNPDLSLFKFYRFVNLRKFPNSKAEFLQPPDGNNLMSIIMTNKHIKKMVKEIFGKFGYRINIRPEEGKLDVVKELEDVLVSFPYSLSSETLQRMVFYLTAMESNQNSVITFEEPEAHAFPYYTKYLAERIGLSERNNQYFIATHNPYLLTSILEKAPKDDIAVFIITLDNYETKVTPLAEEKKIEILEMGSDIFFNLDKLLNQENSDLKPNPKD